MKKISLFLSVVFLSLCVRALDVPLTWTAVTTSNMWGYQVYYGYETNSISYLAPFVTTNAITVRDLQAVTNIHFQLTAVLSNSVSSARSSIFTVTNIPPTVPSGITTP
jgi:hypothetical protein